MLTHRPSVTGLPWRSLAAAAVAAALLLGRGTDSGEAGDPSDSSAAAPEPQRGGKVVYALIAETNNWDPSAGNWAPSSLIVANALFDTLSRYNADGSLEPYLAEGFYPSPDFRQWRIQLREGVEFHNGEPVDAEALAANLEFHRESPLTGPVFARVDEVQVVDDLNVTVALSEPLVQFPTIFTTQVGVLMAPEMLENPDRGLEPIGTGPFALDEWVPDDRMVLVRNDSYWQTSPAGDRLPYLDEIEFRPITDPVSRENALRAGEVDLAQMNEPINLAQFEEDEDFEVLRDPESEADESLVMLNTVAPPFDEPLARQALAHATDRDTFNRLQNDGLAELAEGPFHPMSRWYHDVGYPDYDLDRARQLVAQYEAEHGPFEFRLFSSSSAITVQGAQALAANWEAAGIEVEIDSSEVAAQIATIAVGDYQATMWAQFGSAHPFLEEAWWGCDFVEPIGRVGLNFARNCNEALTAAMREARQDATGVQLGATGAAVVASDGLKPYYDEVQEHLAEDLPYIWLHHVETAVVTRSAVRDVLSFTLPSGSPGLAFNNGAHPLHQMWRQR